METRGCQTDWIGPKNWLCVMHAQNYRVYSQLSQGFTIHTAPQAEYIVNPKLEQRVQE